MEDLILESRQLSLFERAETHESLLYHSPGARGFFTISQRAPGVEALRQVSHANSTLPAVLSRILEEGGYEGGDCYISQNSFHKPTRRLAHLMSLSSAYVDLDPYAMNAPALAQKLMSIAWPEDRADYVLEYCVEHGIEAPSLIMHSGRGLCLKWLFNQAIPHKALPRWNALQAELLSCFSNLGADPQAIDGSRIFRLCGTLNSKGVDSAVRVLWTRPGAGETYTFDFGALCDAVLPYTQAEAHAFKQKMLTWDANRAGLSIAIDRAAADDVKNLIARVSNPLSGVVAATLWWDRLEDIRTLVRLRYGMAGIPAGHDQRNRYCWIVANALAHNCPPGNLYQEILTVFREICPSYTDAEVKSSASSILGRVRAGRAVYKITNLNFIKHFDITAEEQIHLLTLGTSRGKKRDINEGAMGFEKMAWLSREEYRAETTRRRQEAAKYASACKSSGNEDTRALARKLYADGLGYTSIASETGISRSTIRKWLK